MRDRGFRGLIPSSTYRSVCSRADKHSQRINRDATGRAPRRTGVRRARRGTCFVSSTAKTHGVATKRGSNPKKRPFSWVSRPHQKTSIFEPSVRYRLGESRVLTTGTRYRTESTVNRFSPANRALSKGLLTTRYITSAATC